MRPELAGKSLRKRASFSKATPRCPAKREGFPGRRRGSKRRKSRRNPAASPDGSGGRSSPPRLQPIAAAPAVVVPVAAHHAVLEAAVPPVFPPLPVGQDGKPALLAVVQRLVERIGRIGD